MRSHNHPSTVTSLIFYITAIAVADLVPPLPSHFHKKREYNIVTPLWYSEAKRYLGECHLVCSTSGSAGPGFDPRRVSKFSFENFQSLG